MTSNPSWFDHNNQSNSISDVHGPAHQKQKIRPADRPGPLKFSGQGPAHGPAFYRISIVNVRQLFWQIFTHKIWFLVPHLCTAIVILNFAYRPNNEKWYDPQRERYVAQQIPRFRTCRWIWTTFFVSEVVQSATILFIGYSTSFLFPFFPAFFLCSCNGKKTIIRQNTSRIVTSVAKVEKFHFSKVK
jgi:hypothetical protein